MEQDTQSRLFLICGTIFDGVIALAMLICLSIVGPTFMEESVGMRIALPLLFALIVAMLNTTLLCGFKGGQRVLGIGRVMFVISSVLIFLALAFSVLT